MTSLRDRGTHALYTVAWGIVRRSPEPVMRAIFRAAADAAWRRRGASVQRLEANLRRAVGNDPRRLREASRAGMRSYARYWLEVFRLPTWSAEQVKRRAHFDGTEAFEQMRRDGRAVVLVLPHMANWDLAGAWLIGQGYPFTTVAERLRPEQLFDRFVAFRTSLGMEVLALSGGEKSAYDSLRARMKSGGVTCLVADRDLTANGIPVTFLGEQARMPAGPAMLAVATGAALIPVTLWYDGDRLLGHFHDEVPPPATGDRRSKVTAMTQQVADVFAAGIAAHPQDWHMLQKFWVADLSEQRRVLVEGSAP